MQSNKVGGSGQVIHSLCQLHAITNTRAKHYLLIALKAFIPHSSSCIAILEIPQHTNRKGLTQYGRGDAELASAEIVGCEDILGCRYHLMMKKWTQL